MIKSSLWGLAAHWKKGLLKNQSIINQGCSLRDCQLLLPSSFLLSLLTFCIFICLCFSLLLPLPVQLHVILLNPQPLPLNPSSRSSGDSLTFSTLMVMQPLSPFVSLYCRFLTSTALCLSQSTHHVFVSPFVPKGKQRY